jgi:hypothetical protein
MSVWPAYPCTATGYAWAERAKTCGYPERFAMQNLGHGSNAISRAYAKKAEVMLPPLEDYERNAATEIVKYE